MTSRIIPARAGFTFHYFLSPAYPEDHPRSRGVYFRLRPGVAHVTGSSPLARGLHESDARDEGPERIIPARAGFTSTLSVE